MASEITSKPKVVSVLDKLFNILNLINTSEIALSSYDVSEITGSNQSGRRKNLRPDSVKG